MAVSIVDIWRPYETKKISVKRGTFSRLVLRKRHVNRKSEKVMAVNKRFAEVAKKCAGKNIEDFQRCIQENMK